MVNDHGQIKAVDKHDQQPTVNAAVDPSPRSRFQCAFVDEGRDGDILQRHPSRVEHGDLLVSRSSLFPARHDRAELGLRYRNPSSAGMLETNDPISTYYTS